MRPIVTTSPATPARLADSSWTLFFVSLISWASVFHVTEVGEHYTSPLTFAAIRIILPLAILLVLFVRGNVRLPRLPIALVIAASGLLSVSFFSFAMAEGVKLAGAGDSAVLANSPPLWIAFASVFVFRERLSRHAIVGLLVGFGGLFVMFSPQIHVASGRVATGMLLSLGAAVAYAIATVVVKLAANRDDRLDPLGVMTLQHVAGAPALLIAAFATGGAHGTNWGAGSFWAACIPAGLLSLVGATAYVTSLKRRSATHTSLVLFLVPVLALAIEIAFGHMPDGVTFSGMGIVIVGVGLVTRKAAPSRFRALPRPIGGGSTPIGTVPVLVHAAVAPEPAVYGAPAPSVEATEPA